MNGTNGATGATGATGPGATGTTVTTTATSTGLLIALNTSTGATVFCPGDMHVTGGGVYNSVTDSNGTLVALSVAAPVIGESYPVDSTGAPLTNGTTPNGSGWAGSSYIGVHAAVLGSYTLTVKPYALCQ
jgi:hypothetical protein